MATNSKTQIETKLKNLNSEKKLTNSNFNKTKNSNGDITKKSNCKKKKKVVTIFKN